MNVKKLFVNTLLMGAVATAPVGLSSCDDDDGGGGPSEPDVAEGEATATLTGDAETTIVPDVLINVSTTSAQGQDVTSIRWTDTALNSVRVSVYAIGETGTYSATPADGEGSVTVNLDGTLWTSGGGEIGIATNNDTRIAGTLNDVSLSPDGGGSGSVTLNGEFNALKNGGGGGGTANQIFLSGEALEEGDTVSFSGATATSLDRPITHKNVTLARQSGDTTNVRIVPPDAGTGDLEVIARDSITNDNTPSEFASLTVVYGGKSWKATGDGTLSLNSNSDSEVSGSFNNVVVADTGDQNVTINGSFSTAN